MHVCRLRPRGVGVGHPHPERLPVTAPKMKQHGISLLPKSSASAPTAPRRRCTTAETCLKAVRAATVRERGGVFAPLHLVRIPPVFSAKKESGLGSKLSCCRQRCDVNSR